MVGIRDKNNMIESGDMYVSSFLDTMKNILASNPNYTVNFEILNWDECCQADLASGNGFIISTHTLKKDITSDDSIYSRKFGTSWGDVNPFIERYRCKCQNPDIMGKLFEGHICPLCHSPVEFVDSNLDITGWIKLTKYKIIQPAMYVFLANLIGKKDLDDIIAFKRKPNKDGIFEELVPDKKNPYRGIGMAEFYNQFDEITEFFLKKKKHQEAYDFIYENIDSVFTASIPVYSFLLRPAKVDGDSFNFTGVNKIYAILAMNAQKLNEKSERQVAQILRYLYKIQQDVIKLYNYILEEIKPKKGIIRGSILGGRMNFTARFIILPMADDNMDIDEISLPYLGFMELFKAEIVNMITRINNCTIHEAESKWNSACLNFDEKVYSIMEYLINNTKNGIRVLLNRNPTLEYGSIQLMRVAKVKRDIEDFTMSLPLNILKNFNADFDGDVMNVFSIKEQFVLDCLDTVFSPNYMFIDRNDGLFNESMNLFKDQIIVLNQINKI